MEGEPEEIPESDCVVGKPGAKQPAVQVKDYQMEDVPAAQK